MFVFKNLTCVRLWDRNPKVVSSASGGFLLCTFVGKTELVLYTAVKSSFSGHGLVTPQCHVIVRAGESRVLVKSVLLGLLQLCL